jgi:N-acetylglutamate synthase
MITINIFTPNDYDEVYALWQATPGVGLSSADRREAISAYLERNPGLSFVARLEGRLVGAVLCGSDGRRGYLHHLAVHPDFRYQGAGQALVEHCLAGLHAAGIEKCHLFVFAGNTSGREFWEHIDWRLRSDLVVMSKDTAG